MTTTQDLALEASTTYRFAVLDLPLDDAVEALAALAAVRTGLRTQVPAVPGFHVRWPERATLARPVPVRPSTGWQLAPPIRIESARQLGTATATVELLPWDARRTELGLRLERRLLLSDERYGRVAKALLAVLAADLTEDALRPVG
jgi:hypothetical protein